MRTPPGGWFLVSQISFAVLVTIALSFWQVSRGLDKLADKAEFEGRLQAPPLAELDWQDENRDYHSIELRGVLDPKRYFVVENRSHLGRPGFWVFGILNTERERYLVNRGWIPAGPDLRVIPNFDTPIQTTNVVGVIWPNETIRTFDLPQVPNWPVRTREIVIGQMAMLTGAKAYEIRLKCCEPAVFQPAPLTMKFATAIHWGYAAQWLLIGALVIGGYWFFTVRKDRDSNDNAPKS